MRAAYIAVLAVDHPERDEWVDEQARAAAPGGLTEVCDRTYRGVWRLPSPERTPVHLFAEPDAVPVLLANDLRRVEVTDGPVGPALLKVTAWRGYRAYLTRPHDGDSFWVMYDAGCDARVEPELRLADVHAPELLMRLPRASQPGSVETGLFVAAWLDAARLDAGHRRWPLWIETAMTSAAEPGERWTFRRVVAKVWRVVDCPAWGVAPPDGLSLNYAVAAFLSEHPEWPTGE